jgi:hypothetical protein
MQSQIHYRRSYKTRPKGAVPMNRDDIIRMAREAGHAVRNIDGEDEVMDGDNYHIQTELIERFAALVAAAERERIIAQNAPEIERVNAYIKALEDELKEAIRARGEK